MNAPGPVPPFPLVTVSGPPRERGRAYGRQAGERVARAVDFYVKALEGRGRRWDDTRALARDFLPRIAAYDADSAAEIEGIAEGAGVPLEGIVLVNARTEMLWLAKRRAEREADPDGCTGVVVLPEATADGKLIHAQNWDWRADCVHHAVVLRVEPEDGPAFMTFTEAGAVGRSGFNAAGIGVTANFLESDRDYRQTGVPLPLIRRRALRQANYALALHTVYTTAKACSNNMIVSHRDGEAISVECAPDESFCLYPEQDGILVHANHWLHRSALAKLKDTGIADTPDSLYRDRRVRRSLAPRSGRITVEDVKAALFDDFARPWSVCRPIRENLGGNLSATVAMIVMVPADGWMSVCPLPGHQRSFTDYRLDVAAAAKAA